MTYGSPDASAADLLECHRTIAFATPSVCSAELPARLRLSDNTRRCWLERVDFSNASSCRRRNGSDHFAEYARAILRAVPSWLRRRSLRAANAAFESDRANSSLRESALC